MANSIVKPPGPSRATGRPLSTLETETRPDGSTSKNETKLKRTAGSSTGGLVGTWEGSGTTVGSPTVMEIKASGKRTVTR